jgi:eukaryotic-like serine/threonine-protein kinase
MSENSHAPNDRVGDRYQITKFIGEGGMQEVYLAQDLLMDRLVALKTPKNNSAQKRFERSAKVSARINHPNVAKTLDFLEINSQHYLVEEYVPGFDLQKALLKTLPIIDPFLAAKIFHYLAKGIAASHHAGVVHRDLKPSNVMVVDGFNLSAIKITDFGIAKMAEDELAQAVEEGEASISNSSTAVGALPYMSPEMIDPDSSVGKSADIWSLGAMMYELLSGQKPFGTNWLAVTKIMSAEPPCLPKVVISSPQFSALGISLYNLILECLQKNPDARPTADKLVKSCEQLCYPISKRKTGTVSNLSRSNQGFILCEAGKKIFFHFDSVYGEKPNEGSKVCFSEFPGSPHPRAHPVVVMLPEKMQK